MCTQARLRNNPYKWGGGVTNYLYFVPLGTHGEDRTPHGVNGQYIIVAPQSSKIYLAKYFLARHTFANIHLLW